MNKRSTIHFLLMNLITLGFYSYYFWTVYGMDVNDYCVKDKKNTMSYPKLMLFLIPLILGLGYMTSSPSAQGLLLVGCTGICFPLVNFIWFVRMACRLNRSSVRRRLGYSSKGNVIACSVIKLLVSLFTCGAIIYLALFQTDFVAYSIGLFSVSFLDGIKYLASQMLLPVGLLVLAQIVVSGVRTGGLIKHMNEIRKQIGPKKRETGFIADINAYGFKYSMKDFYKQLIIILIGLIIISIFYQLKWFIILILMILAAIITPPLIRTQYQYFNEQARYDAVTNYMEQMIYSFKKQPKIREALLDAQKTSKGTMQECITRALQIIDDAQVDDIYKTAFAEIENEFKSKKLKNLHKFLIKVEARGGKYLNSIDVLLDDVKSWEIRTYAYQNDIKNIKRNVLISSACALATCGALMMMLPGEYRYSDNIIYQLVSALTLLIMTATYYAVSAKLKGTWLDVVDQKRLRMIKQDYKIYHEYSTAQIYKMAIPIYILIAVCLVASFLLKIKIMTIALVIFLIFFLIQPSTRKKNAKKRLEREILKEYPVWLRDMAINLQFETVQSAIQSSIKESPFVLKAPLKQMIQDFERYPTGIEPYDNFMSDYNLIEIQSSMKMLYSLNALGKDEADKQINSIIERNVVMLDKAEKMANEDKIGIASFLTFIPMFIGVVKMLVDLVLMLMKFTDVLGNMI